MARTITETGSDDGGVYFLLARDRWTIIRNSVFAAIIGGVWVLLAGLVYAASSSLLSWTLIIPALGSWACVQYVFTAAKLGLRIGASIVEVLQVGRKCEIDKARIRDVVVHEKLPVGREKRNDADIKHYLGLELVDGTIVMAFYDLKKSVLENARNSISAALELDRSDNDNSNDGVGDGGDKRDDAGGGEVAKAV